MKSSIDIIKAALATTADSGEATSNTPTTTVTPDAPLLPYEEKTIKPKGLDLGELSLKPIGDLRRMKPIVEQLDATTDKIKKLDEEFTALNADVAAKIKAIKDEKGYEKAKINLKELTDRAATEVQRELQEVSDSYGESKKLLLEYREKVYTIYDEIKTVSVSDKERLELLNQSMAKLLSPELIKSVSDLVNTGIKQLETAKSETKRKFVSWTPSKTLHKEVKEELPKKLESLQRTSDFSSFLSGLWKGIKNLFAPIKDNAAELQSLLETSMAPLTKGIGASKTAAMPTHLMDSLLDGFSFQDLIDAVFSNEPVRDEAAVKKVFKDMLATAVQGAQEELRAEMPLILKTLKDGEDTNQDD